MTQQLELWEAHHVPVGGVADRAVVRVHAVDEAALLLERRLELGHLLVELAISRGVVLPTHEVAEALGVAARPGQG